MKKCLYVDDSSFFQKVIGKYLASKGISCKIISDGKDAISDISKKSKEGLIDYDFIIIDNNMENVNGTDAVKEIRSLNFTKPIFGYTASNNIEDYKKFIENGANIVISKNEKLDILTEILKNNNIIL